MQYLQFFGIIKYYTIDKTAQTLRNWDKNDSLKPHHVKPGGTRYYSQEQLNHFLGLKQNKQLIDKITNPEVDRIVVLYNIFKIKGQIKQKMIKELLDDDIGEKS